MISKESYARQLQTLQQSASELKVIPLLLKEIPSLIITLISMQRIIWAFGTICLNRNILHANNKEPHYEVPASKALF